MSQPKIILIAGPTASGKSALALELAHAHRGVVINADAMQIYAGLPILSAQPNASEMLKVPHRLYGVLDATNASSAGKWLALATVIIRQTVDAGTTPILVGGTGLYFAALMRGLAPIPPIPAEVHTTTQDLYDVLGEHNFRAALARIDSESALRLAKNDRQRMIRAYAVALHTGKPLGDWRKLAMRSFMDDYAPESHLLNPERQTLYAACDQRFAQMLARGAIDEADQFLKRNLNENLPAMKTIGLRELAAYLKNEIGLDEAIAKGQQASRNYAKRQMTWFRNQWPYKS
jgi:tRNA dimethylallyltransferase